MASAYLGPAADFDLVSSLNRSEGLTAGPRAPLPHHRPARRRVDLAAIAESFTASAACLPELRHQAERTWILLAATDLFEAWAIGWPPGGAIELHDHGHSSGAVVVAVGALIETTARPTGRGMGLLATRRLDAGQRRTFGPGYVHDLTNEGDSDAVSVHIYGPRLDRMAYYRIDRLGRLAVVRSEVVPAVGPFDTTSEHDPS